MIASRSRPSAEPCAACASAYPPIDSFAFLADGRTAALIGVDGGVEWLCTPRFDGASAFARLLDRARGGAFRFIAELAKSGGAHR